MISVLDTTKALYLESSHKNFNISIPGKGLTFVNGNIDSESAELTEVIEDSNQLEFKGCYCSQLKIRLAELSIDVRGEYIEVTITAEQSETIPYFRGYVVSQTNRTYEDVITEIECQDVLYKIRDLDVLAWYNTLGNYTTIKNFRDWR